MKTISLAFGCCLLLVSLVAASPTKVKILGFDPKALPPEILYTGNVVAGARWLDDNGENLLLLCETGPLRRPVPRSSKRYLFGEWGSIAELYGYHYVKAKEKYRLLWKLYDFAEICQEDIDATFLPNSLSITDLDGNGIAESTFLYKLACRGGIDPAQLKLIMHEGNSKYALRGETLVPAGAPDKKLGGQKTIDPAFRRAPKVFLDYAVQQWNTFVEEKFGE
jgi:hypothetical protein